MKKQLDTPPSLKMSSAPAWSMSSKCLASDSNSARSNLAPMVPTWKKYCEDRLKQFASAR
jgi:hypothetical protein